MKTIFLTVLGLLISVTLTAQIFSEDTLRTCGVDSVLLDAGSGFDAYFWNTGETTQQIYARRTHEYKVSALLGGVETLDSIYVDMLRTAILERDTSLCYGADLTLSLKGVEPECLRAVFPIDDGSGEDLSGNGHHGLPLDVIAFENRYGEANRAGYFSPSVKSRIVIPRQEDLELTSNFTVSAWINPAEGWGGGASDGTYYIVDKWRTIMLENSAFILGIKEGGIVFFRTTNGTEITTVESSYPLTIDRWYHLVAVMENGELSLYIGDLSGIALDATLADAALPVETPTDICIGAAAITDDHNFKGAIDDVRLYTCALSSQEVTWLNRVNRTYDMTFEWSDGSVDTMMTIAPHQGAWYSVRVDDGVNRCKDSVYVDVFPEIHISMEQVGKGCPGSSMGALHGMVTGGIPFEDTLPGQPRSPYTYSWSPIVFNYDSIALRLQEGDYTLTVVDSVGCRVEATGTVETYEAPGVEAEADPEIIYTQNPKIKFTAESDEALTYYWDFGDTTSSVEQNPEHIYKKLAANVTAYEAWVFVEDINGCVDSTAVSLPVQEAQVEIPNVFTPNGDGVNDFFEARITNDESRTLTDIYKSSVMVVYNLHGQKVYVNNEFSGQPGTSWDGGNHDDGTYFYILRCKGYFKEDLFQGAIHLLKNPPKDYKR
ncbi:MAG: hypothetical protein CSA95_03055 [Bacteroidetes bacterium]|nr:MAG: hypothetical protein CSA95_03055 [Bacteroidota bacterium]PIE88038.1 MAG: hypothetical protein CSA04_03955 [Bacteroidota bacterium]